MKQQTPSKEEKQDARLVAARLFSRMNSMRGVKRQERQIASLLNKVKKPRVLKPKPKRRPTERVTIISIGGQPVEEKEDAFIELSHN